MSFDLNRLSLEQAAANLQELAVRFARPTLYRENAFLLFEMPVTAPLKTINKRKQMMEISLKTGAPTPPGPRRLSLLERQPLDEITLEAELQQLRSPISRILEEFFWFWEHDSLKGEDLAWQALKENQTYAALTIWHNQLSDKELAGTAFHNIAILQHLLALENEINQAIEYSLPYHEEELSASWNASFSTWDQLLLREDIWSQFSSRIRALDDPRVTTGDGRRFRQQLPRTLLMINARLAIQYLEEGNHQHALRHIMLLEDNHFEDDTYGQVVSEAIDPYTKRILQYCKNTVKLAQGDPIQAHQFAHEFNAKCEMPLSVIDSFNGHSSAASNVKEEIVETGITCATIYTNMSQDWDEGIRVLNLFATLLDSPSQSKRFREKLEAFEKALEIGDNWCHKGYYQLPESLLSSLEKAWDLTKQGEFQAALEILQALESQNQVSENTIFIHTALAYLLNVYSDHRFAKAADQFYDQPPYIVQAVGSRFQSFEKQIVYAAYCEENGFLEKPYYQRNLCCMACGSSLFRTQFHVLTINDLGYVICKACNTRNQQERDHKQHKFATTLQSCARDVQKAAIYNPQNKAVTDNYAFLRKIATDLSIKIPDYYPPEKSSRPAGRSSEPQNSQPARTTSKTQNPKPISFNTWLWVFLWVVAGVGFCLIIYGAPAGSRVTPTPRGFAVQATRTSPAPTQSKTPARTSTRPAPTNTALPLGSSGLPCHEWSSITIEDVGTNMCVYGMALDAYSTEQAFFITFDKKIGSFFLISYDWVYQDVEGHCVLVEGKIAQLSNSPTIVLGSNDLYDCSIIP